MSNSTALAVYQPKDLAEVKYTAQLFAESGMFSDARQMAQAFVKIMAGGAMGFDPFASMNGIHIIQGKPSMGAGLIAAAIDRHTEYDYEVLEHDTKQCVIKFLKRRNGEWVQAGVSSFTMEDARIAKVWNGKDKKMEALADRPTWKSYPRNMLYARAMSNGARWYCAGVFGGSVYTPEEMGADVDAEGDIVEAVIVEDAPAPQTLTIVEEPDDQGGEPDDADLTDTAVEEMGAEVATAGQGEKFADLGAMLTWAINEQKYKNKTDVIGSLTVKTPVDQLIQQWTRDEWAEALPPKAA